PSDFFPTEQEKVFISSTPFTPDWDSCSLTERLYKQSDQRRYHIPCTECGEQHILDFKNLKWPKNSPEKAVMLCPHCGAVQDERCKMEMLARGEWRTTATGDKETAGFHINALYHPDDSWESCAEAIQQSRDNSELRPSKINCICGESALVNLT
ncbi:phage terminase large subunit family protein, partial [Magnetococcales bacterium HHB-1]